MYKTSDVLFPFYFTYVFLSLKDHKLYIGFTTDIAARVNEHQIGYVKATRNRLPLKLLYYECFINREDAKARERFLKSGFGRTQLKKELKQTFEEFEYKYSKSEV